MHDHDRRGRSALLTYPEVGATRAMASGEPGARWPAGYHVLHRRRELGDGAAVFEAARERLRSWAMQRAVGGLVTPAGPPEQDVDVLVRFGVGPLRLPVPCRVVWTVDEPGWCGFAYGTLPGHPETGEEAFVVERCADGRVVGTVLAFSRPGTWYARLAGPLGRVVQWTVAGLYLRALRG